MFQSLQRAKEGGCDECSWHETLSDTCHSVRRAHRGLHEAETGGSSSSDSVFNSIRRARDDHRKDAQERSTVSDSVFGAVRQAQDGFSHDCFIRHRENMQRRHIPERRHSKSLSEFVRNKRSVVRDNDGSSLSFLALWVLLWCTFACMDVASGQATQLIVTGGVNVDGSSATVLQKEVFPQAIVVELRDRLDKLVPGGMVKH